LKVCILTIGTRGDVQPYVALGTGLKSAGHSVTIATLAEFKSLVEQHGLQHASLRGDFLKAAGAAVAGGSPPASRNPLRMVQEYVRMASDTLADE